MFEQMKGKLTTKSAQHFTKLAEPVASSSRQIARKTKRTMKKISAQLIPVIALSCGAFAHLVYAALIWLLATAVWAWALGPKLLISGDE